MARLFVDLVEADFLRIGIADEGPSCALALSEVACCSAKPPQAANTLCQTDIGAKHRAVFLQHMEKAPLDIATKGRMKLHNRNRSKDAVTRVCRDHPCRDIVAEVPMQAIGRLSGAPGADCSGAPYCDRSKRLPSRPSRACSTSATARLSPNMSNAF